MPTHFKGSPRQVRALNAFIKLMRASETVNAKLLPTLTRAQLTTGQFGVLEVVHHLGPMTQCDIARKLLRSGANVTTVLDNLEKRGLIRRERGIEDRRFITIHLTDAGKKKLNSVFPKHVEEICDILDALDPAEQEELGRLCRKVGQAVKVECQH
ncbi:MAG TPA: MarR family transcriptional regulator [Tepidisphaeraceae bacterium]|jgi:MarR family 2-MHQ and catechol resistance regulon transcriptional repressor